MFGIPAHVALATALPIAFALGLLHGVTPDEHTWPITFSYAVGSYSSKGGRMTGLRFSLSFALQRAITAEIAWFALSALPSGMRWDFMVDAVIGAVMAVSGAVILRHARSCCGGAKVHREPSQYLPYVHGFLAGWGVGAFAIVVYTILVPAMPSAWIGWLPGALFGLGTMAMQVLLGGAIGAWMERRRLGDRERDFAARHVSGRTLVGTGIAFVATGVAGLAWPGALGSAGVSTHVAIPNLARVDVGLILALPVVVAVAAHSFWWSLHHIPTHVASSDHTDHSPHDSSLHPEATAPASERLGQV